MGFLVWPFSFLGRGDDVRKLTGRAARGGLVAGGLAILCCAPATAGAAEPPPGRGYELVSPADKNGVDVQNLLRMSQDGRAYSWASLGAYGDPPGMNVQVAYAGHRSDRGWGSRPFSPYQSDVDRPTLLTQLNGLAFDGDLTRMAFISSGRFDPADRDGFGQFGMPDLFQIDAADAVTWISHGEDGIDPTGFADVRLAGRSEDGSTLFFQTTQPLTAQVPPDSFSDQLYRWRDGTVTAVGFDTSGRLLENGSFLGNKSVFAGSAGGQAGQVSDSMAVSDDGRRFVYGDLNPIGTPLSLQLYLYTDGQPVKQISLSQREGSVGEPATTYAQFVSATPDLAHVVFQSGDQLTDDAPVGGGDYIYDTETGELTFSHPDDSATTFLGVPGLTAISDDARYVYFISPLELADGARAGEPNLFVRHDGVTSLIGTVDSESGRRLAVMPSSGDVPNTWYTLADVSSTGTRLVFEAASLDGANTGEPRQVYLYDATSRTVRCLSCRSDGARPTGRATLRSNSDFILPTPRAITEAGDRVVFTSAEALVEGDINGTDDVYEYVNGQLYLVSSGTSGSPSHSGGISPDGQDLYFTTRESLVAQDIDRGLRDIYDARVGGGFPVPPPPEQCSGDACQGELPQQTPVTPPASSALEELPPAEVDPPEPIVPVADFTRVTARQLRTLARTGRLVVRVRVNEPGRVGATLRARVGRRTRTVGSASKDATRPATVRLSLRLSRAARRALASNGQLAVRLSVSYSKVRGARTQRFTVKTRAATSRKRGNR